MNTITRTCAWTALALMLLAGIDANFALPTLHDSLLPAVDDAVIGAVGMCTPCDTLDASLPRRPLLDVATLLMPPCGVA